MVLKTAWQANFVVCPDKLTLQTQRLYKWTWHIHLKSYCQSKRRTIALQNTWEWHMSNNFETGCFSHRCFTTDVWAHTERSVVVQAAGVPALTWQKKTTGLKKEKERKGRRNTLLDILWWGFITFKPTPMSNYIIISVLMVETKEGKVKTSLLVHCTGHVQRVIFPLQNPP